LCQENIILQATGKEEEQKKGEKRKYSSWLKKKD
jgi:hypothetical protein